MATTTTVQLGSYAPLTGSFTLELDINDRATYFVDEIKTPQPKKQTVEVWNIRTVGTRYVKQQHQQREITVTLYVQAATVPALLTALQNLQSQVEGMSVGVNPTYATTPAVLKLQAPNATAARYSLVLKTEHTIDYAVKELISNPAKLGGKKRISLIFSCWPFSFSIPRQWLANGVNNPGFEAPSGPAVSVFFDSFASTNAYSVQAGSAPTLASNVMTIPSGTRVAFGSPAWGAINSWLVRFQFATSLTAAFYLHFTDANDYLYAQITGTAIQVNHNVAGTIHTLASGSITLTNGTFYWLQMTQFPSVSGNPPQVQVVLSNDSGGAIGTTITTQGPVATFDAVTALVGRPQISASGASLAIGGNFSGVHQVNLFGPGGWTFVGTNGSGACSGAWDGARPELGMSGNGGANTYPNGPVTSFGAARIDFPPAGTANAYYVTYTGGTPAGTSAIPVQTPGNTIQVSLWARGSGLHATHGGVQPVLDEYDSNGTFLRQTFGSSVLGSTLNAGWTQLTMTVVTGASTAYVGLFITASDTAVAGESANATIWFDNVQVWDQSRTGMATMPYCELRFPQSPAQLMVSGLLGDAPAQAQAQIGLYFSAWNVGHTATVYAGRRGLATVNSQMVYPPIAPSAESGISPVLDSASYGGYYVTKTNNAVNVQRFASPTISDAQGTYRVFSRLWTSHSTPSAVSVRIDAGLDQTPYAAVLSVYTAILGQYYGAYVFPFTSASTWTFVDAGNLKVPMAPLGGRNDPTKLYVEPTVQCVGGAGDNWQRGWAALMPVDGEIFIGILYNASNALFNVVTQWLWVYVDANVPSSGNAYSLESAPLPNAAHAGGVAGNNNTGNISVNPVSDSGFWLDPMTTTPNSGGMGVNQWCLVAIDDATTSLPNAVELLYSPEYLYPL